MTRHPTKLRNRLSDRCKRMMALADRAEGVTMREAYDAAECDAMQNVSGWLAKLVRAGYLWSIKRHHGTRYFGYQEDAQAWGKANAMPVVQAVAHRPQNWSLDLPGTPKHLARPPGSKESAPRPAAGAQVITPEGVKHTVRLAPKFDARFQVDPDAHHYGAGFSHVGIGRDVQTGKAWR